MLEKLSLSYDLQVFQNLALDRDVHCVKSVRFGAFFWSVFPRIQSEYVEIRTKKAPSLMFDRGSIYVSVISQPAITYSKLTIGTVKQGVKYAQN